MSLLSFFANQRRRWFDQRADYPADYFAGAWAALLRAEADFLSTPIHNARLEAQLAQSALKAKEQELVQAREQVNAALPQLVEAKRVAKEANRTAQQVRRQVALTRRALLRMSDVASADGFEPEVRMRYLQTMICTHLALLRDESPDAPPR